MFLILCGSRICSIVGIAFWEDLVEFDIFLMDGLKNAGPRCLRNPLAHEEQVQAASLRPILLKSRGKLFIVMFKMVA